MRPTPTDLIAARLSRAAYLGSPEAELEASAALGDISAPAKLVDCGGGTQVLFAGDFVAFRGTDELADVADDLGCLARPVSGLIRAWDDEPDWHRGFERAWLRAEPAVRERIGWRRKPVVFCGHSLGGALAMLAAAEGIGDGVSHTVVTFGAPRAGNAAAMRSVKYHTHHVTRYVHNSDVVPRLPPAASGLVHPHRSLHYIDVAGRIHFEPSWAFRAADRLRGRLRGGLLDGIRDHRMDGYVAALSSAASRVPN